MIDTHCHLNVDRFSANLPEVLQRAKLADITLILVPGIEVESSQRSIELAKAHDFLYSAVGLHPCEVQDMTREDLLTDLLVVEQLLTHEKVLAVGEVGLDCYHTSEDQRVCSEQLALQVQALETQIEYSIRFHKPLILHNRDATTELLEVLNRCWDESLHGRVIFHCCSPEQVLLDFAIKHDVYMGVDGDVTYDQVKQEFVKQIPDRLLLLETDAPYLLPEPLKSQKQYPNEPAHLTYICSEIATLRNQSVQEIDQITTQNALRVLGLL